MKWRVEIGDCEWLLDLNRCEAMTRYTAHDGTSIQGEAEVRQVMPGVYSVLDANRSYTVRVVQTRDVVEAWVNGKRVELRISDPRDRTSRAKAVAAHGPQEVRALMPGKVIKLLVVPGEQVKAGAGIIVVEAMKMQNEMKSPKDGRIVRIHVDEGATVGPGEPLILVE